MIARIQFVIVVSVTASPSGENRIRIAYTGSFHPSGYKERSCCTQGNRFSFGIPVLPLLA
jgi:hypothetical protein